MDSRRDFLAKAGATAALLPAAGFAQGAEKKDDITVAVVGCGGRGTGAAAQSLNVPGTRLVAMADAFADNVESSYTKLKEKFGDRVDVPKERRFSGFEGAQKAIDAADVVLLCTPPGFRPIHFEYAVEKGKHVFMEKPVAVDAPGIRQVLAAAKKAEEKDLKIVCGLQRRYQTKYLETLKQVEDGAIGDIRSGQVYWNSAGVWTRARQPGMTEMEYQMRNWYYFNWICGDHIAEQHVHNIDVMNWFKGQTPVKASAMGGRQVRIGEDWGEIFDHFFVEFTYADGTVMNSQCRHQPGTAQRVSETIVGSKGSAMPGMLKDANGKTIWRFRGQDNNPYQVEHDVLYDHIRNNKPVNNVEYTAEATMTTILGRMAAYSGKVITWDEAMASERSILPETFAWDADPGPKPNENGIYPCPIPGQTEVL